MTDYLRDGSVLALTTASDISDCPPRCEFNMPVESVGTDASGPDVIRSKESVPSNFFSSFSDEVAKAEDGARLTLSCGYRNWQTISRIKSPNEFVTLAVGVRPQKAKIVPMSEKRDCDVPAEESDWQYRQPPICVRSR